MPDTGGLADYLTTDEMRDHLLAAIARFRRDKRDVFVHIGFHQETAVRHASRVMEAIRKAREKASDTFTFETLRAAAKRARSQVR